MPIANRFPIKTKFALVQLWLFLSLLTLLSSRVAGQEGVKEPVVNLCNPTYQDGLLFTEEGGVVTAPALRVQARRINYVRQTNVAAPVHTLKAEGDLMLEYGKYVFIGERLEYDFLTGEGVLYHGRGAVEGWYAGGERIKLLPDRTICVEKGYLTTCENRQSEWGLKTSQLRILQDGLIQARKIRLTFLNRTLFALPYFQMRPEDWNTDSPLLSRIQIGGATGSSMGIRYRLYQRGAFAAYSRLEYFFNRGPGLGLETKYQPRDRCARLCTASYLVRDRNFEIDKTRWRYRLAGSYHDEWAHGAIQADGGYEWLSDEEMPSDYRFNDFNLLVARRSYLTLSRVSPWTFSRLRTTPRLNTFQTFSQQLPVLDIRLKTLEVGQTGILLEARASAGYLNYVFARPTSTSLFLARGFQSLRGEIDCLAYLPINREAFQVTPEIGFAAVGYNRSQLGGSRVLFVGKAGIDFKVRASKWICENLKHVIEPYTRFEWTSRPTTSAAVYPTADSLFLPRGNYVFTYEDGYTELYKLRFGVRNLLCSAAACSPARRLMLDLYAYAFIHNPHIPGTIPRLYADVEWNPTCSLSGRITSAWNFPHKCVDHFNAAVDWTLSESAAISAEYLYRSPFDWRKADYSSFYPDTFHSEAELLNSGMSNRRHLFIAHLFVRLTPIVSAEWQSRYSWKRKIAQIHEKSYHEYRITLRALLGCRFHLVTYFERDETGYRFNLGLNLGKPCKPCQPGWPTVW